MSQSSIGGAADTQRVLVTAASGRRAGVNSHNQPYHTDPNCFHVRRSESIRPVDKSTLRSSRPECKWCAGEISFSEIASSCPNPDRWVMCVSCGAQKVDGECQFCDRYEDVMGDFA